MGTNFCWDPECSADILRPSRVLNRCALRPSWNLSLYIVIVIYYFAHFLFMYLYNPTLKA